jgi:hypothetical protein
LGCVGFFWGVLGFVGVRGGVLGRPGGSGGPASWPAEIFRKFESRDRDRGLNRGFKGLR